MEWDQVVYGTIHNVWPILGAQSFFILYVRASVYTWCNVKKKGYTTEIEQYVQKEYEIMLYIELQKMRYLTIYDRVEQYVQKRI